MAKNQFLFTIRFALFLNKMIKSTEKITTYFQVFCGQKKKIQFLNKKVRKVKYTNKNDF